MIFHSYVSLPEGSINMSHLAFSNIKLTGEVWHAQLHAARLAGVQWPMDVVPRIDSNWAKDADVFSPVIYPLVN